MRGPSTWSALSCVVVACGPAGPSLDDGDDDDVGDEVASGDLPVDTSDDSTSDDSTSDDSTETSGDSETGPVECEPIHEGSVLLDQDSTPADFESLECVEHITGDLELVHTTLDDLGFLSALIRVDGHVELSHNAALIDLHGLDALEHIGTQLLLFSNDALIDLHGLESLHELGGLSIAHNPALTGLDGLTGAWHMHAPAPAATGVYLSITNNHALTSLDALADITSLAADLPVDIYLSHNSALVGDLVGLEGIAASDIDLGLALRNNHLESLIGLEGLTHARSIELLGTGSQYTSLAGLDNLVSVENSLTIGECQGPDDVCADCYEYFNHFHLASLDGLESLQQVGHLQMWGNLVLGDIDALAGLQTVGDVHVTENPMLPQAAVDSLLANVELLGEAWVGANGTGEAPICGFIPQ